MKLQKNKVIVTRKWLLNFADVIYNPKTKEYLNLCNGTLQNGPDPKNKKRTMHCGLGELYFQLTGKHPIDEGVDEEGVIDAVIRHSSLLQMVNAELENLRKTIENLRKLNVVKNYYNYDSHLANLLDDIKKSNPYYDQRISKFRQTLDGIPSKNDDDGDDDTLSTFRARSRRVAHILRKAARLLPLEIAAWY